MSEASLLPSSMGFTVPSATGSASMVCELGGFVYMGWSIASPALNDVIALQAIVHNAVNSVLGASVAMSMQR